MVRLEDVAPPTHSMTTRLEELTGALENGDLWWLYARESKEEIVDVVRLTPQERIRQRTVEQIDDAGATGRGRNG